MNDDFYANEEIKIQCAEHMNELQTLGIIAQLDVECDEGGFFLKGVAMTENISDVYGIETVYALVQDMIDKLKSGEYDIRRTRIPGKDA